MSTTEAITASRFSVTIDGTEVAAFSELQGISTAIEVVDFHESTDKDVLVKKLPGRRLPPTVVLKRGKNNSMELWAWHEAALRGEMESARRSCSLVMYGSDGKPVARYHLEGAWPSKIEIGGMKAGANEVLMESVTIVCEHIQRVSP